MDILAHTRPYLIARHHCISIQLVPHDMTFPWQSNMFIRVSMASAASKDHEFNIVKSY